MVDDGNAQLPFRPLQRVGVRPLARQEQGAETVKIVLLDQLAIGVVPLDGPECRGSGEQDRNVVFRNDAPKDTGIRRPHGFSFEQDGRTPMGQRPVNNIGMADGPAQI